MDNIDDSDVETSRTPNPPADSLGIPSGWASHPTMKEYVKAKARQLKRRQDERTAADSLLVGPSQLMLRLLAANDTGKRSLALALPTEVLDMIFFECLDEWTLADRIFPPRTYAEREDKEWTQWATRHMLMAFSLVHRAWTEPAQRCMALYLHVRLTSKSHCDAMIKRLRRPEASLRPEAMIRRLGRSAAPQPNTERLEVAFPSPFYHFEEPVPCSCEASLDAKAVHVWHDEDDDQRYFYTANEWNTFEHSMRCTLIAAKEPNSPSPAQLDTLFRLCSRPTRLELVDVQALHLEPWTRLFAGLASLTDLEVFACSSYMRLEGSTYSLLCSSWPRLHSLYLEELAGGDSSQRGERWADEGAGMIPIPRHRFSTNLPPAKPLRKLKTLAIKYAYSPGLATLAGLFDPEDTVLETLSITGQVDEMGRHDTTFDGDQGISRLPASLCKSLRSLTLAGCAAAWGIDEMAEWLAQCRHLIELSIGPEPYLANDELLASFPASLERVFFDLDCSWGVINYLYVEMDLANSSPRRPDPTYITSVRIPTPGAHERGSYPRETCQWTKSEGIAFIAGLVQSGRRVGQITRQSPRGFPEVIYDARSPDTAWGTVVHRVIERLPSPDDDNPAWASDWTEGMRLGVIREVLEELSAEERWIEYR